MGLKEKKVFKRQQVKKRRVGLKEKNVFEREEWN